MLQAAADRKIKEQERALQLTVKRREGAAEALNTLIYYGQLSEEAEADVRRELFKVESSKMGKAGEKEAELGSSSSDEEEGAKKMPAKKKRPAKKARKGTVKEVAHEHGGAADEEEEEEEKDDSPSESGGEGRMEEEPTSPRPRRLPTAGEPKEVSVSTD